MKAKFYFFVLCTTYTTLSAQWLNHPTPGMPRTKDGKPNLSARAPRTKDGKPDLSGLWGMNSLAYADIAADLKPEDVQPWADALFKERIWTATTRLWPSASPKARGPISIPQKWRSSSRRPAFS
jgi:hypothetical protein